MPPTRGRIRSAKQLVSCIPLLLRMACGRANARGIFRPRCAPRKKLGHRGGGRISQHVNCSCSPGTSNTVKTTILFKQVRVPRGFTLLELLVVVVIIGLLAGLVVPRYFDTVGKSKAKIARAQMDAFDKALEQYRLDVGTLPSQEQGLPALVAAPSGATRWQGPYLKKAVPLDPWGNPYIYKLSESRRDADIISLGADGQAGGTGEAKDVALSAPD